MKKKEKEATPLPRYLSKGKSVWRRTPYNSYVDVSITDDIVQEHNAMSFKELRKLDYK